MALDKNRLKQKLKEAFESPTTEGNVDAVADEGVDCATQANAEAHGIG